MFETTNQITMENHNFNGYASYKWAIFNSYVKSPESKNGESDLTHACWLPSHAR